MGTGVAYWLLLIFCYYYVCSLKLHILVQYLWNYTLLFQYLWKPTTNSFHWLSLLGSRPSTHTLSLLFSPPGLVVPNLFLLFPISYPIEMILPVLYRTPLWSHFLFKLPILCMDLCWNWVVNSGGIIYICLVMLEKLCAWSDSPIWCNPCANLWCLAQFSNNKCDCSSSVLRMVNMNHLAITFPFFALLRLVVL